MLDFEMSKTPKEDYRDHWCVYLSKKKGSDRVGVLRTIHDLPNPKHGDLQLKVRIRGKLKLETLTFKTCSNYERDRLPWVDITYRSGEDGTHIMLIDTRTSAKYKCVSYSD